MIQKITNMKKMRIKNIVLLAIVLTFVGCGVSSVSQEGQARSSRQDRKAAEFEKVAASIESGNYRYTITMEIGDSGYGTLVVSGQKRQSISYYGVIGEFEH